ncbi:hypothetical protein [Nocardia sp. NPDC051832]|uniref:hypothetical protein n=1 Tax=Nocardia sp. NPDC051832 TaxID=3155673 RepID=UPI0034183D1A
MPEEDPGDSVLRHRQAVLDALLSDPEFDTASVPSPVERTRGPGPSATDRINELLSARDPSTAAHPFSGASAELPAARLQGSPEPDAPVPAAEWPAAHSATAARGNRFLAQLRKPRVALALLALSLVLVAWLLNSSGEDTGKSDQVLVITPTPQAPAPSSPPPSSPVVEASTVAVRAAESHCPPGSTDGMDAFGGEPGKAWSCVRAYRVDGQLLRIDFGGSFTIETIGIVPGWDHVNPAGEDQWTKYRTVSRLSYQFDDADETTYTQKTLDQRTLVVTKFDPPIKASGVVVTILESKGPPSINTTAISSIVITGH